MSDSHKVLYLVPFGEPVQELIKREMSQGLELITPETTDRTAVLRHLKEADFAIAIRMDAEMIGSAPRLRLIQLAGVGFDGVDLEAATRAGIPVAQAVEGTIIEVAEHTLLLILALYKRLLEADASLRRGEWLMWQLRPTSFTLNGKNVGILGLGRIGRQVALRCRAFGAELYYHDVLRAKPEAEKELGVHFVTRDELLSLSDVVTLHLPLTATTKRCFGENEFRLMKSSAIFINTARGALVDESALVRALEEGWIAGAGLDVFQQEPPGTIHPLLKLRTTVLTPHIAAGTRDSILGKARAACDNFRRVLEGRRPLNVVNEEVYRQKTG